MKAGSVAALDIGSSKVVCFIAKREITGNVLITGIGHQVSQGVRAGIIIDVKQAETSILSAVHAAEKMAGETVDKVLVSVGGPSVSSQSLTAEIEVNGQEVNDRVIQQIVMQGFKLPQEGREVLHCIPGSYTVNDVEGVHDPRSMYCDRLKTELHIITASSTYMKNLSSCLARCHLDVQDFVAAPYASGVSCLTEDEKQLGATLVDIGGSSTSIAIFYEGNLVHTHSIPIGGMHITKDVARGLSTNLAYAERIKNLYGCAIKSTHNEREVIDISLAEMQSDHIENSDELSSTYISRGLLTSIIQPRVEEIFEMVRDHLMQTGYNKILGPRVVLVGGTSQLQGIRELGGYVLGKHIRVGKPNVIEGLAESTKGPAFATVMGMLEYGLRRVEPTAYASEHGENKESGKEGYVGTFMKWLEKNF